MTMDSRIIIGGGWPPASRTCGMTPLSVHWAHFCPVSAAVIGYIAPRREARDIPLRAVRLGHSVSVFEGALQRVALSFG